MSGMRAFHPVPPSFSTTTQPFIQFQLGQLVSLFCSSSFLSFLFSKGKVMTQASQTNPKKDEEKHESCVSFICIEIKFRKARIHFTTDVPV